MQNILTRSFKHLELELGYHGSDTLEVKLINRRYAAQRRSKFKQAAVLLCLYCAFYAGRWEQSQPFQRHTIADIGFVVCLLYVIISTLNLVKHESLIYCSDFALQLQTLRCMSRCSSIFLPASNIFDIVINEVIEDLDVHYILIARIKNSSRKKLILAIFNNLRPPIECLEIIYNHVAKLRKNTELL